MCYTPGMCYTQGMCYTPSVLHYVLHSECATICATLCATLRVCYTMCYTPSVLHYVLHSRNVLHSENWLFVSFIIERIWSYIWKENCHYNRIPFKFKGIFSFKWEENSFQIERNSKKVHSERGRLYFCDRKEIFMKENLGELRPAWSQTSYREIFSESG